MKHIFYRPIGSIIAVFLLLSAALAISAKTVDVNPSSSKYYTISGIIETSSYYCGGAHPSKELIRRLREKKPHIGYKLYIREGKTNNLNSPIIDSTVIDENGKFEFQLLPGEYVLLSAMQKDRAIIRACLHNEYIKITDFDCVEDWWQNGLTKLIVHDRPIDNLYFHIPKACYLPSEVPCLVYGGPRYP